MSFGAVLSAAAAAAAVSGLAGRTAAGTAGVACQLCGAVAAADHNGCFMLIFYELPPLLVVPVLLPEKVAMGRRPRGVDSTIKCQPMWPYVYIMFDVCSFLPPRDAVT